MCPGCRAGYASAISRFKASAIQILAGEGPVGQRWNALLARAEQDGVPLTVALGSLQSESAEFLRRYVSFAFADGEVTPDEVARLRLFARSLAVPSDVVGPLVVHMERGAALTRIRSGRVPRIRPAGIYLELDEICHLDAPCVYLRVLKASVTHIPGRMVVSNRKFRFLGRDTGWELGWGKVMSVRPCAVDALHLQASQNKGSGTYRVADPEYAGTVVETVARMSRREILQKGSGRDTRVVPQDVKATVWQRDGGRCVECGSDSYLEFDHVIPHSKGGATSVNNLQLLCRGCNLSKGARL